MNNYTVIEEYPMHLGLCEGCFTKKYVRIILYKDNFYKLCRKCRGKLSRNALTLEGITQYQRLKMKGVIK